MSLMIGIIADDLTGANDSGVQLAEKGLDTSVLFDIPEEQTELDSGVVIDTNSRALSQEEAFSVTKKAALFLKEAGYRHIYKKMDSTLRGHIGTELKAIQEVFEPDLIVIAPAFPPYGRTTKDGIHFVKGEEVSNTEISKDPKHPVKESFIPGIIENEILEKTGLLRNSDIHGSVAAFQQTLSDLKKKGIKYLVCDAETQEDLQEAARKIAAITNRVIWAGSAGLAEVLPEVLKINSKAEQRGFPVSDQVMTVCGSLSQVTQDQVKYASDQPGVGKVEINTMEIFSENWKEKSRCYISDCAEKIKQGKDLVLYVPSHLEIRQEVKKAAKNLGLTDYQTGEWISRSIGEVTAGVAEMSPGLSGFILTGGDTAKDASRLLGGVGFRLIKQIEAGIPLGVLIGPEKEYTVVTKAGAFGDIKSIYQAMEELKGVHAK